jgi:NAD(P)-dependent dehydrogenase (short-subunit alcohol dehydrogenase family)
MPWRFAKTSVITGAGSGIGRALASELAGHGFKVGVSDIDLAGAQHTLEMVRSAGGTGEVFRCDVRNAEEVQKMADHFFALWGEVGLLVNNAGLMASGYVEEIPLEEWRKVVDTDLWGPVHGCRAFLPRMKKQAAGHILITASVAGVTPPLEESPYNVAKAGAIALGESLKTELAPFNIGVTILNPMGVNTNVVKNSYCSGAVQELWETSFKATKLTPEDIARKTIRAVCRNRLYIFPHLHGKMFWYQKRFFPETFFGVLAFMHKKGAAKPWLRQMAKRGWL